MITNTDIRTVAAAVWKCGLCMIVAAVQGGCVRIPADVAAELEPAGPEAPNHYLMRAAPPGQDLETQCEGTACRAR